MSLHWHRYGKWQDLTVIRHGMVLLLQQRRCSVCDKLQRQVVSW